MTSTLFRVAKVGDSVLLRISDTTRTVEMMIPCETAIEVADAIESVATGARGDSLDADLALLDHPQDGPP